MLTVVIRLPGDVSQKEDVLRLAKEMETNEPNGIQLLVNNAGVALDEGTRFSKNEPPIGEDAKAISEHFLRSEMEQWDNTFRINVTAPFCKSAGHSYTVLLSDRATCRVQAFRTYRARLDFATSLIISETNHTPHSVIY